MDRGGSSIHCLPFNNFHSSTLGLRTAVAAFLSRTFGGPGILQSLPVGKYIHLTRYGQIVETQSLHALNDKEHHVLSEYQKHSSVVSKMHYKKRRSCEIAVQAHKCLQRLLGARSSEVNARFGATIECTQSESARPKTMPRSSTAY